MKNELSAACVSEWVSSVENSRPKPSSFLPSFRSAAYMYFGFS